jgi:hypothetical protein
MAKLHKTAALVTIVVLGGALVGCGTNTSATVILPQTPTPQALRLIATAVPTATPVPSDA